MLSRGPHYAASALSSPADPLQSAIDLYHTATLQTLGYDDLDGASYLTGPSDAHERWQSYDDSYSDSEEYLTGHSGIITTIGWGGTLARPLSTLLTRFWEPIYPH
jgi:hypothetical protein